MKDGIKNVFKSIAFVGILFFLVEGLTYYLLPQENIRKYGIIKTATYEILAEKEDTIDAVIIGDSLIYSAISPMEIWHQFGFTVYDCANAAQLIKDSYNILDVVIESQHPRIVFFEANVLYRNPKNKSWYLKLYREAEDSVPIFKYHNNWKYDLFNFLNNDYKFKEVNYYKGYKLNKTIKSAKDRDYMKVTDKPLEVSKNNHDYFAKMVQLAKDNNTELIIISTPNMKNWSYAKHLGVEKIAKEYGLEFIDMNIDNPAKINWHEESKDAGDHLNFQGALKVSNFLGEYLKNKNFVDHRQDSNYLLWHEAYEIYKNSINS